MIVPGFGLSSDGFSVLHLNVTMMERLDPDDAGGHGDAAGVNQHQRVRRGALGADGGDPEIFSGANAQVRVSRPAQPGPQLRPRDEQRSLKVAAVAGEVCDQVNLAARGADARGDASGRCGVSGTRTEEGGIDLLSKRADKITPNGQESFGPAILISSPRSVGMRLPFPN
jgi:hypothetical protein